MKYLVQKARHSDQAAFPFRIIYADYRLIGPHEDLGTKSRDALYDSILENGYAGPPITVLQSRRDTLFESAVADIKVSEAYGALGIADGHHRFKAISQLGKKGLLKSSFIPVQLIPAHNQDVVRIGTLRKEERPLSVEEIEDCFADSSKVIPLCTSHFQTKLTSGEWVKLEVSQPNIHVDRETFIAT